MLPIAFDYAPMDAKIASKLPEGREWQYEPKWDGFRCLAFKDGENIELISKSGQSLARYFPEVVAYLQEAKEKRFVLDGELVLSVDEQFSFNKLLERIHPAATRVKKLAFERPATYVVFDILVDSNGNALVDEPLKERRIRLEKFISKNVENYKHISISPICDDLETVKQWQKEMGERLDGIVAKNVTLGYQSGNRLGMVKVKWLQTADCVVGGFRYAKDGKTLGSLLLGLYDDDGLLNHVGFTSAFKKDERESLLEKIEPYVQPPGFTGNAPGGPSRWSTERSTQWQPLQTKFVVEVQFDRFSDGRFRHGTKLLRWRLDKSPQQCTYEQF